MAIINTRVDRFPKVQKPTGSRSLLGQLRLTAHMMLKAIGEADEVHCMLRRQRYASLLG
jgi:hypothetical protein